MARRALDDDLIVQLSSQNFDSYLTQQERVAVLFYHPKGKMADYAQEQILKAARSNRVPDGAFAKVNCQADPSLCAGLEKDIPLVRFFVQGKNLSTVYNNMTESFKGDQLRTALLNSMASYAHLYPVQNTPPSPAQLSPGQNKPLPPAQLNPGQNKLPPPFQLNPGQNKLPPPAQLNPRQNKLPPPAQLNPGQNKLPPPVQLNPLQNKPLPPAQLNPGQNKLPPPPFLGNTFSPPASSKYPRRCRPEIKRKYPLVPKCPLLSCFGK